MNSHIIHYYVLIVKTTTTTQTNSFKKENVVSLTIVFNETVSTNLIKTCPFSVTKWEVCIKYFYCIPKDDGFLKEKHFCN